MSGRDARRTAAVVALGGALGAALRHGCQLAWPGSVCTTLAINVSGCFLIGVLLTRTHRPLRRAFLGTGALGGFTTFSAYAVDTVGLLDAGRPLHAAGYLVGTVVAALTATHVGMTAGRPR